MLNYTVREGDRSHTGIHRPRSADSFDPPTRTWRGWLLLLALGSLRPLRSAVVFDSLLDGRRGFLKIFRQHDRVELDGSVEAEEPRL